VKPIPDEEKKRKERIKDGIRNTMSLFAKPPAPPTAKPKYKVLIAVNVPAYAEVEIEAESQADAERKVAKELDECEDEFASRFWQNSVFNPDWQQAEDFRIVEG
jgi:hypothetical protein